MNLEKSFRNSKMETDLKQIHLAPSWVPLESFTYRGITVDCYEDCIGHQVVFPWRGKVIELGEYNTVYQDDIRMILDDHLDTITRFSEYPELYGSKLTRFQNGSFSDIKLVYRGRILKVYINPDENDLFSIMEDAKRTLYSYINRGDIQSESCIRF
jgi:hypothetical protein